MMRHVRVMPMSMPGLLAMLAFVAGCAWLVDAGPVGQPVPDDERVWVQRTFIGGQQCEPRIRYAPPDTGALLRSYGVLVHGIATEMLAVCAACGCPAYAAIHYAEIARAILHAPRKPVLVR